MQRKSDSKRADDRLLTNAGVENRQYPRLNKTKIVLDHTDSNDGDDAESDQWTTTIDDSDQSIASSSDDEDYDDDGDGDDGESSSSDDDDERKDENVKRTNGDDETSNQSSRRSTSSSSDVRHNRDSRSEESHSYSHTSTTSKNYSKSDHSRKQNDHHSSSSNYSTTNESEKKESNEKLHPPSSSHFSDHRFENENSSENEEYFESVQDMTYYSNYAIRNGKDTPDQCDKRDYKLTNHNFGFPNHVNRFYILEQDCSGDKTSSSHEKEKFQQQDEEPPLEDQNDERQDSDCDKNHDEQNALSVHSKTSHTQSSLHDSDTLFDFGLLSDHDIYVDSSARFDSGKREIQFDHFEKVKSKPTYKISNLRRKPACRLRFFTPKYGVNWSEFQRNVNFTASMTNKRKHSNLSRCTTDYKPDQLTENDEPYVLECQIWDDKKNLAKKWSSTV